MEWDTFDKYVQKTMESWHCPGVSLAILKNNEWIYKKAFGFSDIERGIPLSLETRFPLASVTKSVTAMSVALLVDDGLLDWNKPVSEYLPEFCLSDPYATRHATVSDLLSHRTGLPRHDLAVWRLKNVSRSELIHRIRHFALSASFREKYQYCNLLYNVAAHLVEKLAGQRWEDFVAQRIFQALKMTQTTVEWDLHMLDGTVAKGYRHRRHPDGSDKQFEHVRYDERSELSPGAAGSMFSTLDDMGQWLKVQLGAGSCDGVQLITPENLKPLHSPQTIIPVSAVGHALTGTTMLAYGMGWRMRPYAGGTLIDHGGNTLGHSVVVGFMPATQIGVVVLCNAAFSDVPHVLLHAAVDHALKLPDKDWSARFHAVMDPLLTPKNSTPNKPEPTTPARPFHHYEGRYTACGYPEFHIRQEAGQLRACTHESLPWSELQHSKDEVFEWYVEIYDAHLSVSFQVDDNGDISALSIPMEAAVPSIVFVRESKQPQPPVAFGFDPLRATGGIS